MFSYIWKTQKTISRAHEDTKTRRIEGESPLMWREHCLECAMPLCYKTCKIYKPRMDGRCLRFDHGIVPVTFSDGVIGTEISFRRWAKLQADFVGLQVCTSRKLRIIERCWNVLSWLTRTFCDCIHHYRLCQIEASLSERINSWAARKSSSGSQADGFLAEIENRENEERKLLLEIEVGGNTVFKTALELKPGWNTFFYDRDVMRIPDDAHYGHLLSYLEDNQTGVLDFHRFSFVEFAREQSLKPAKKVKCVAWDLDNTLWEGVIGDIGAENVKMKPAALELIKKLDERGIIQTIVSKNTYEVAWAKLEKENLAEYFLYPAINWGRKSNSMKAIAKALNINIDTFALIDDSVFERNEVKDTLPQVRVYDESEISILLTKEEFDIPITAASKGRRLSYKQEEHRNQIKASWSGDYDSFLRSCELKMRIFTPKADSDMKRCLELLNRSNQYNISGKRYETDELKAFLSQAGVEHYAFTVKDKYGDYGIVGYATLVPDGSSMRLLDFVMSCRVAQKKVERAFVWWLLSKMGDRILLAMIRKTDRNKPLQDEFRKMPVSINEDSEEVLTVAFRRETVLNDNILEVIE